MGNRFLQDVKAVIEWEQGVFTESDNQGFLFGTQHRRLDLFGSHRSILNVRPLPPLGDGFGIDPILLRQASYARLTCLNCATNCLCRSGATVEYLCHSCSFSRADTVPLYSGTIHLISSI